MKCVQKLLLDDLWLIWVTKALLVPVGLLSFGPRKGYRRA
jgi:hypothetical protein